MTLSFGESIPAQYETILGPFLFEPFAADLADRLPAANDILEVACGTGRLTRRLADGLASGARLTATDVNPDMLTVARLVLPDTRIHWAAADMAALPFGDGIFDLAVSQFGLMFPQDKKKALAELKRVLRVGGRLVFSTWATAAENPLWAELGKVVREAFGEKAPAAMDVPFAMSDQDAVLAMMEQCGFAEVSVERVRLTCRIGNAALAAKGMVEGLPVANAIRDRAEGAIPRIEEALEKRYIDIFGEAEPMQAPLIALVCKAFVL